MIGQKEPRVHDNAYLKAIRKLPCSCGCGRPAPSEAAHIRSGSIDHGKRSVGLGEKPHDRWAVPLSVSCHLRQHAYGNEMLFWQQRGVDPFKLAIRLYAEHGQPAEPVHKTKPVVPRKPREQRTPVPRSPEGHQRPWPSRKIVSRGFGK